MTDLAPDRQTIVFPVQDDEQPDAHHVWITVKDGELTWEALSQIVATLSKATCPSHFELAAQGPPPQHVPLKEAARIAGTHPDHILDMIDGGFLRYTRWRPRDATKATPVETARLTGDYTGWQVVVDYAHLVEVCAKAREVGEFPVPRELRRKPMRNRHWDGKANVAELVREALRQAKNSKGDQVWVATRDIERRVRELIEAMPEEKRRSVTQMQISTSLRNEVQHRKTVERKREGYNRTVGVGNAYLYRWKEQAVVVQSTYDYEAHRPEGWLRIGTSPPPPPEDHWIRRQIKERGSSAVEELRALLDEAEKDLAEREAERVPLPPSSLERKKSPIAVREEKVARFGEHAVTRGKKRPSKATPETPTREEES